MTGYLDISGGVTPGQHAQVLQELLAQFEDWRNEKSWCTDLYFYVGRLTATYWWDKTVENFYPGYKGQMKVRVPEGFTDEDRGRDLREVRGRILRFTLDEPGYLAPGKANEFLRAAGLQPHEPSAPKRRYYVDISTYVDSELTSAELKAKLEKYLRRQGSPGAQLGVMVTDETSSRSASIPASDTVRLLPVHRSY